MMTAVWWSYNNSRWTHNYRWLCSFLWVARLNLWWLKAMDSDMYLVPKLKKRLDPYSPPRFFTET